MTQGRFKFLRRFRRDEPVPPPHPLLPFATGNAIPVIARGPVKKRHSQVYTGHGTSRKKLEAIMMPGRCASEDNCLQRLDALLCSSSSSESLKGRARGAAETRGVFSKFDFIYIITIIIHQDKTRAAHGTGTRPRDRRNGPWCWPFR